MKLHQVQQLAETIGCKHFDFPLQYLGLSLTNKGISKQFYKNLIDGIQDALSDWQASNISLVGQEVLVNTVLCAKSIYFMSLFQLPKWVIKVIDNIRRHFLWHDHKLDEGKSMCLVNWRVMKMSKIMGDYFI
jgi:hypothetical protein